MQITGRVRLDVLSFPDENHPKRRISLCVVSYLGLTVSTFKIICNTAKIPCLNKIAKSPPQLTNGHVYSPIIWQSSTLKTPHPKPAPVTPHLVSTKHKHSCFCFGKIWFISMHYLFYYQCMFQVISYSLISLFVVIWEVRLVWMLIIIRHNLNVMIISTIKLIDFVY